MLETFLANLKKAIRNRETVSTGGGKFSHEELRKVLDEIEESKFYLDQMTKKYQYVLAQIKGK